MLLLLPARFQISFSFFALFFALFFDDRHYYAIFAYDAASLDAAADAFAGARLRCRHAIFFRHAISPLPRPLISHFF